VTGEVTAVSRSSSHGPRKGNEDSITLIAGVGVEGDAHSGATVQHLSRKRNRPDLPNLRQVHLIHSELHHELRERGFDVAAGLMGENVTTRGVDLLALPVRSRLRLGDGAEVEITGLRNPCKQLEGIQAGLMEAVLDRAEDGTLVRRCGVMAIVVAGGVVRPGEPIEVQLPSEPHRALQPV
jgi:MOSC domain-containing protein YiiM